jgi:hypothetical protein
MKMISAFARVLILATSLAAPVAYADILLDTTGSVMLTDPTQLGRLSRNGDPQNWGGVEPFSGVINTTTTYHYTTFFVEVGLTPFIQIDFNGSANVFVSAYLGSYNPASMSTNWLGDAGFSGLLFGTDVPFFDVKVAPNSIIAIVVNNTAGGNGGVGDPFHLIVEGYIDAEFTSSARVPEPSTLLLCFLPLVALLGREAWKRRRDVSGGIAA